MPMHIITQPITAQTRWPLHNKHLTHSIERAAQAALPPHTLMARAGLATAQLALAIAPHANTVWIACGPGNNGGDGLEAAVHLKQWGKLPIVTWLGQDGHVPPDAQRAYDKAQAANVVFQDEAPETFDIAIDAILGIGCQRAPEGQMRAWLNAMSASDKPVLCIDMPTGLMADTGEWLSPPDAANTSASRHTLSLLTLKPGLFTGDGQDAAGCVWFNDLGVLRPHTPSAWLQTAAQSQAPKPHNSHKGSFGDVVVIGGSQGMTGAAILASLSALHGGAGRVFLGLLDAQAAHAVTAQHPALMLRNPAELSFENATVVCGCGGGDDIRQWLPLILSSATRLVLDADALNAIANDTMLLRLLTTRHTRQKHTVLTPHPLEAARLLQCTVAEVQKDRLYAAQQLADRTHAIVALKGSGTIVTSSQKLPVINITGNARLATAGTGDVLSGLIGAKIVRTDHVFEACCLAVGMHGAIADQWPQHASTLDAALLAASVC